MAVQYINTGVVASGSTGVLPSGLANGDWLLLIAISNTSSSYSVPSGWNNIPTYNNYSVIGMVQYFGASPNLTISSFTGRITVSNFRNTVLPTNTVWTQSFLGGPGNNSPGNMPLAPQITSLTLVIGAQAASANRTLGTPSGYTSLYNSGSSPNPISLNGLNTTTNTGSVTVSSNNTGELISTAIELPLFIPVSNGNLSLLGVG